MSRPWANYIWTQKKKLFNLNTIIEDDIVLHSELSKTEVDKNILNQKFNEFYKKIGIYGLIGITVGLILVIVIVTKKR